MLNQKFINGLNTFTGLFKKKKPVTRGRKTVLTDDVKRVIDLLEGKVKQRIIAEVCGISISTVSLYLKNRRVNDGQKEHRS